MPYDVEEGYKKKRALQRSFLPQEKVLDTSMYRIAFNRYQDYSLAQAERQKITTQYVKLANQLKLIDSKLVAGDRYRLHQTKSSRLIETANKKLLTSKRGRRNWE